MISFTKRFVILFLIGAAAVLLSYARPWFMYVVVMYNSLLIWLAVFDYILTRPDFDVHRVFQDKAGLGRPVAVRLLFVNKTGYALHIEAEDTPPKETRDGHARMSAVVPPRATGETAYSLVPERRGDKMFGPLYLRLSGRLGLIRKRIIVEPEENKLRVFPDVSEFRKYELMIRKGFFYLPGMRPSRFRGRGTSFERLREYQPDDDYQHINWKATAKLARPVVMEYEIERNQNIFIMIDAGRLMSMDVFGLTKLDHALRAALVLATVCTLKGDNVGLLVFSKDVRGYLKPGHGRPHLARCMDMLYNLEPTEDESDYSRAFEFLLSRKMKRSLVVVFSDFVDLYASETLIKYLSRLHPAHLPLCVTLRDSDIEDAATAMPEDSMQVFRKTAALAMLEKRNAVFHRLARRGVNIINARPEKLSSDLIQKYLELKSRLMV